MATPQIILNYAAFLEEHKYFEVRQSVCLSVSHERSSDRSASNLLPKPTQTNQPTAHPPKNATRRQDAFRVYERGVSAFGWPHVKPLWTIYLDKFVKRCVVVLRCVALCGVALCGVALCGDVDCGDGRVESWTDLMMCSTAIQYALLSL